MGQISMDMDNGFTNEEYSGLSKALDLGTGGFIVHKWTQSNYTSV
jgi:hypothetical protein